MRKRHGAQTLRSCWMRWGKQVNAETVAAISPWRFFAQLSPDMAAAREGRALALADILKFCRAALRAAPGMLLVEGVGGAMSPLNTNHTMRDWIVNLKLPSLLVTGSYLGAISHTLTTAEALLRAGEIAAIVISESQCSPVPAEETAASIARFLPGIALHIIPRHLNDLSFSQSRRIHLGILGKAALLFCRKRNLAAGAAKRLFELAPPRLNIPAPE